MEIGIIKIKEFENQSITIDNKKYTIPIECEMSYHANRTNLLYYQKIIKKLVKEKFNTKRFRFRINHLKKQLEIYK